MKINDPFSVLLAVSEVLNLSVQGFKNVMKQNVIETKELLHISDFVSYAYDLSELCLKLSDPSRKDDKLSLKDKIFLHKLYNSASDVDLEDEQEEMEDDKEQNNG